MNWNDISIEQFQELQLLEDDMQPIDKLFASVSICHKINLDDLDNLPQSEFSKLAKEIDFIVTNPFKSQVKKRYLNYRFVPNIREIKSGVSRYIELKHWNKNHIENMHYVISSMVQPQRKNWLGIWRDVKYESKDYEKYASDLRNMPITLALGWVGFFLQALERSKKDLENSSRLKMILRMMWKYKMPKKQVEAIVAPLWPITDGSTK